MCNGMFFKGFTEEKVGPLHWRLRRGGHGPQIMLLHGRPETHACWNAVAPALARDFTVICPDLHPELSIQEQARHLLSFADQNQPLLIAGQDIGAIVASQMAREAPEQVKGVVIIEAVPRADHSQRADMAFVFSQYESCWFGQLHPKPESQMARTPTEIMELALTDGTDIKSGTFATEALQDYVDFPIWAGSAIPTLPHHQKPMNCPLMVLWAAGGRLGGWYDPPALWQSETTGKISGHSIPGTYFLTEESPQEIIEAIRLFAGNIPDYLPST